MRAGDLLQTGGMGCKDGVPVASRSARGGNEIMDSAMPLFSEGGGGSLNEDFACGSQPLQLGRTAF